MIYDALKYAWNFNYAEDNIHIFMLRWGRASVAIVRDKYLLAAATASEYIRK